MKLTKTYCDICNAEVFDVSTIVVGVTIRNPEGYSNDNIVERKDICDNCLESIGFKVYQSFPEYREQKRNLDNNFGSILRKFLGLLKK
jgi:hypothetical protein